MKCKRGSECERKREPAGTRATVGGLSGKAAQCRQCAWLRSEQCSQRASDGLRRLKSPVDLDRPELPGPSVGDGLSRRSEFYAGQEVDLHSRSGATSVERRRDASNAQRVHCRKQQGPQLVQHLAAAACRARPRWMCCWQLDCTQLRTVVACLDGRPRMALAAALLDRLSGASSSGFRDASASTLEISRVSCLSAVQAALQSPRAWEDPYEHCRLQLKMCRRVSRVAALPRDPSHLSSSLSAFFAWIPPTALTTSTFCVQAWRCVSPGESWRVLASPVRLHEHQSVDVFRQLQTCSHTTILNRDQQARKRNFFAASLRLLALN